MSGIVSEVELALQREVTFFGVRQTRSSGIEQAVKLFLIGRLDFERSGPNEIVQFV
jgi:hypothetical protein